MRSLLKTLAAVAGGFLFGIVALALIFVLDIPARIGPPSGEAQMNGRFLAVILVYTVAVSLGALAGGKVVR